MEELIASIENALKEKADNPKSNLEVTVEVPKENLLEIAKILRDRDGFKFEALIDLCGVDYLDYGISEWMTDKATGVGFDRAADRSHKLREQKWNKPRFAVVYHLLSYSLNQRLRLKVFLDDPAIIVSVVSIWSCANWYEREAFDLYGILFDKHPDLRRILTDYGFIGYPFRKDFPLSGRVEVRYDKAQQRVIYEPVKIQPRILVPKVIREDSRYISEDKSNG